MTRTLLLAALLASALVSADEGQAWSVVGARTNESGRNVLAGSVGWPGLEATFTHGVTSQLDLGARFTFNYGYEGIITGVLPGVRLQGVLRARFFENGRISAGVSFMPGPTFYFPPAPWWQNGSATLVGFVLPVGFTLGIAASSAVQVGVSLDIPFYVRFGNGGGASVPLLTGAGLEYFLQSSLALFFSAKMGPTLSTNGAAAFTLDTRVGLAWHF